MSRHFHEELDGLKQTLLAMGALVEDQIRRVMRALIERIGDQAVNIAQRTLELNHEPQLKPYIDLPRMAEKAQRMVKESLDAFVVRDTDLARRVCAEDADVDALKEQIFRELLTFMMEDARRSSRRVCTRTVRPLTRVSPLGQ